MIPWWLVFLISLLKKTAHLPRHTSAGEKWRTYVADDREDGECVEDAEPCADVLGFDGRRPLVILDEFVRVQTHFNHVVDERAQRRQRKRRHEDRHETELDHCTTVSVRS